MEVDDVLDLGRRVEGRSVEQVLADRPVELGVCVGIGASQLAFEDVAGEVVRAETVCELLDEGSGPEPVEQFVGALAVEQMTHEPASGHAGHGQRVEYPAVFFRWCFVRDALEQPGDQVRRRREVVGNIDSGTSAEHLCEQDQCERMPTADRCHGCSKVTCQAAAFEQLPGLRWCKRTQCVEVKQRRPGGFGAPLLVRRVPAGDHHDGAGRQELKQMMPHPVAESAGKLERVDRDDQPLLLLPDRRHRSDDGRCGRLDRPQIDRHDLGAGPRGACRHLPRQR
ncbi:MAG: hypothetical protein IT196_02800 [Acidimicrobiales bacterium]|nr:hypothetical protein [Acidimicrobiales bacterium]